jgi:hypothetical protein
MILSEYEAKRADLDRRLQEVGEREAAHKMELIVKYQAECKKIQSQIGQLKKKQKELLKTYQNDKQFFHRKYRDEKHEICEKMHTLRLEYLTVNNIETKETRKHGETSESA